MFISKKNYKEIINRLNSLEDNNRRRVHEHISNEDKIDKLNNKTYDLIFPVYNDEGFIEEFAQVDIRDVVRSIVDACGLELKYKDTVEGHVIVEKSDE